MEAESRRTQERGRKKGQMVFRLNPRPLPRWLIYAFPAVLSVSPSCAPSREALDLDVLIVVESVVTRYPAPLPRLVAVAVCTAILLYTEHIEPKEHELEAGP